MQLARRRETMNKSIGLAPGTTQTSIAKLQTVRGGKGDGKVEAPSALRPSAEESSSPSPAGAVARRAEEKHSSCRVQRMELSAGHQMLRQSSRGCLGTELHTVLKREACNTRWYSSEGLRLSCDYHFYPALVDTPTCQGRSRSESQCPLCLWPSSKR